MVFDVMGSSAICFIVTLHLYRALPQDFGDNTKHAFYPSPSIN